METLGLSESTPRTESRIKSLLWPSIESGADVDYLGSQGFWVISLVSVASLALLIVMGQPFAGALTFIFLFFGGVGVRERNLYAAIVVFLFYVLDTFFTVIGIVRVIIGALLLSNVRATWICSSWDLNSEEQATLPPRFGDTFAEKLADKFPQFIWPKIRIIYYIYSAGFMILTVAGLAMITGEKLRP